MITTSPFIQGIKATICTDGVTQTDTTLSHEYLKAYEELKLTPIQILKCIENGFLSSFQPKNVKEEMAANATKAATKIMKENGISFQ